MALQPLWNGSELLHKLIADYLAGAIGVQLFCDNFEQAFNFDIDRNSLTEAEDSAFTTLFHQVVFFSPHDDERAEVPNYRSEEQIHQAAEAAAATLRS